MPKNIENIKTERLKAPNVKIQNIAETSLDTVKFRGKNKLEEDFKVYNDKIEESNEFIENACKDEIDNLKKAQAKFETKLKSVMKSEHMIALEEEVEESSDKVFKSMRNMQRELTKMHQDIEDNDTLNEKKKNEQYLALNRAAAQEFARLSDKYPSAMKAQLLSNFSRGNLLM